MNGQKIDCQARIHQHNHGLISDSNFELGSHSSHQLLGLEQQPWNMGIWVQQPTMDQGVPQQKNLEPAKSPSSIMSRFESPTLAFYATERCMGFPSQYDDSQVGNPNPNPPSQFPSGQSYDESYSEDIRNTLQSIVKSQTNSSQSHKSSEISNQIPSSNLPGNKLFLHQQMSQYSTTASVRRPFSLAFKENQEQVVCIFFSRIHFCSCFCAFNFQMLHHSIKIFILVVVMG